MAAHRINFGDHRNGEFGIRFGDGNRCAQARASVDGTEVRAVTANTDWHVPLSNEGTTWLNGMFNEVILGWQSFSPDPGNDLWMDDVVLSTSPIGCN